MPNGAKNSINSRRRRDCHAATRHFSAFKAAADAEPIAAKAKKAIGS
jgi:transcriptional regulator NrdR family protein